MAQHLPLHRLFNCTAWHSIFVCTTEHIIFDCTAGHNISATKKHPVPQKQSAGLTVPIQNKHHPHYHKAPDECSGLSTSKPMLLAALHSLHSLAQWIATQATSSSTSEALGPSESNDSAAPTLLLVLQYIMVNQNIAKLEQAM